MKQSGVLVEVSKACSCVYDIEGRSEVEIRGGGGGGGGGGGSGETDWGCWAGCQQPVTMCMI